MSETDRKSIDEYGNVHQLSKELARGGQGVVYRTSDSDLAIKMSLESDGNSDYIARIADTFRRVRTLPLPKGIHLSLPLAILRDEPGYVMRLLSDMKPFSDFSLDGTERARMGNEELPLWVSGIPDKKFAQDLAYYAKSGSTRRRLYALYKCAVILARLHNAGIVYGDISANNAFIGQDIPCDCWLIDADNLRLELHKGGHTVYTPQLGAPEIVQGIDCGRPRTDCWAFAVMAFQILSLCHPFIGRKVLEPEAGGGWDAETSDGESAADMDDEAYAGKLPYIDDEEDDSNSLPPQYENLPRQLILTPQLRRLFQETFGAGRLLPHRRPSMVFWALELAKAFDSSIECPSCHMSYYYTSETCKCPYCQTEMPTCIIAQTSRWQKILTVDKKNGNGQMLPKRMFEAFSLENSDEEAYRVTVEIECKKVSSMRGTSALPSNVEFSFVNGKDVKQG